MIAKSTPQAVLHDDNFKAHFWAGVSPSTNEQCWPWMRSASGPNHSSGRYGQTFYKKQPYKAHRVAFFLAKGFDAKVARHSCDNSLCCNPHHIIDGTHKDNTQDMLKRGRCNPPIGERSGHAKLTNELVTQIRVEYAAGGTSYTKIAEKYNVCFQLIGQIVKRKIWRYIP